MHNVYSAQEHEILFSTCNIDFQLVFRQEELPSSLLPYLWLWLSFQGKFRNWTFVQTMIVNNDYSCTQLHSMYTTCNSKSQLQCDLLLINWCVSKCFDYRHA